MAIRKVCGIETEYGISVRGADSNPVAASSVLINAYIATLDRRTVWDFEDESPGIDARGFAVEGALPPDVETHLVNTVLTNGARYYVDHAHPEVSTPECVDAREVVVFDRAAEEVLKRSMVAARSLLPDGAEIVVYKNNSDGKGNSYGCHENYLLARELPFGRLVTPDHAPLRDPAGVLRRRQGGERVAGRPDRRGPVPAQPAGRLLRGGGRARDHAQAPDREHPRRTALRRAALPALPRHRRRRQPQRGGHVPEGRHDGHRPVDDRGRRPCRSTSRCPTRSAPSVRSATTRRLTRTVLLKNGRRATALDVQWQLLEHARKYERERGLESVGEEVGAEVLRRWEEVLTGLERRPGVGGRRGRLGGQGAASTTAYQERHGIDWADVRLRALDLQYHDLRDDRSLFDRLGLERLCIDAEVERAMTEPPTTRGPTSGASACRSGRTTSWPPTGTRWCSTSGATRCGGCR